ncbi:unnamed protein product [Larinioides sclopetarius]|uniref:Uncharacterized protein n=1 Tax=Larinioides sclopetarius TaxID=280406 RepID=A0AAV2BU67_9ARAC
MSLVNVFAYRVATAMMDSFGQDRAVV